MEAGCGLTDSVQMKSRMKFIRGNRCIEKAQEKYRGMLKKDNFKYGGEVKRLKERTLAFNSE